MRDSNQPRHEYEADVRTVDMVCDRLADLGLAIGPDTARDLIRAIVAAERPRIESGVRELLETQLRTIRVATQSALGILGTPPPDSEQPQSADRKPAPRAARRTPAAGQARPPEPEERRPVFRRPRGR